MIKIYTLQEIKNKDITTYKNIISFYKKHYGLKSEETVLKIHESESRYYTDKGEYIKCFAEFSKEANK